MRVVSWKFIPPIVVLASVALEMVAKHKGPLSVAAVAEETNCSLSYMEVIFATLRDAGMVRAKRGPGGGYELAKPVSSITVEHILVAFTDPERQVLPPAFAELEEQVRSALRAMTLQKLMEKA